jgi:hypothetical protein
MLVVEKIGPMTLSLDLQGQVTASDIDMLDGAIRELLDEDGQINLLVDLAGITDVTAGAVAEDLKVETALLPHLGRFGRMAAISDKAWISSLMRAAGHLMPRLEFRTFTPEESLAARAFVLDDGAGDAAPAPGVRFLPAPHPRVIAYEIDGVIRQDDVDAILERLNAMLSDSEEEGHKISLLVRFTHFGGFAPMMLLNGQLWTAKLAAIRNLHRYAIVGGGGWMEGVARLADPVTAVEMKCFPATEEDAARDWVVEGL